MGRRKRKITYIDADGKEIVMEDAIVLDLSKGSLEDLIETAIDAEIDDETIRKKANEIKIFLKEFPSDKGALEKWYQLGKILSFVDKLKIMDDDAKREAFRRIFDDLKADPDRDPAVDRIVRYPLHMYNLAKLPKSIVFIKNMTWSKWFDILEYNAVYQDRKLLGQFVRQCSAHNWNAGEIRKKVQILNRQLKGQKKNK